ncbi:mechanosensitive ion channel family protein [Planctomycetota bacterium]|nr:mechanosensitive ion channel family protein [Planctomycetota bacterium]
MLDPLWDHVWISQFIASIIFVVTTILLRWLSIRWIKKSPIRSTELRRKWLSWAQQMTYVTAVLGLIIIWATEIQTLAFSFVAFAVAFIIATKELVLCLMGGMYKASTGIFTVGDRINVSNMRGQVVSQGILSTKLLEVGPGESAHQYTGRTLTVPNALFLSNTVINETITGHFGLHSFIVPIKSNDDWRQHEDWLLEAAEQACKPHIEEARSNIESFTTSRYIESVTVNPRIIPTIPDADHIDLVVRIPVPAGSEGRLQRLIIRKYLQLRQPKSESQTSENEDAS